MVTPTSEVDALRHRHYNAVVTSLVKVHDDLLVVRVLPDYRPFQYIPGQYTVLGLGFWEPRLSTPQKERIAKKDEYRLARRAYSISCRLIDDNGQLQRPNTASDVEFYIALVRETEDHAPALTPRLFLLHKGDRLHMGTKAHGRYTLEAIQPGDDILFCATGTGEAPHNSMIAELLSRGHQGRIVSIVSVRYHYDLAYQAQHRALEARYANYRYIPLTTREPENIDASNKHFVGKRYIQSYFETGQLEAECDIHFSPDTTHVFLCGNPAMIGLHPPASETKPTNTQSDGMVEVLTRRGFQLDRPHAAGNIHVEQYW